MSLPSLLSTPSLWTLIDNYLLGMLNSWKANWLETANAEIVLAEQFNPDGVEYPIIIVSSYERTMAEAEPVIGSGQMALDGLLYPYEIVVSAAFDVMEDAKVFAANVCASLIDTLRADATLGGLVATNGEYVKFFSFDDGELFVRGLAGQNQAGQYTGTAVVRIDVNSEVH